MVNLSASNETIGKAQWRRDLLASQSGRCIAAYAYGGREQIGPVAGTTQEAATCAIGWALGLALKRRPEPPLRLYVPERFYSAVETLIDGGARIRSTLSLFGRDVSNAFDRCAFGGVSLP